MTVQPFVVSPFAENCYVCHDAGEAALLDPGTTTAAERQAVLDYIEENNLTVRHLLLTHAHLDHVFGCAFFAERFGLPWRLHAADAPLYRHADEQARLFGTEIEALPEPELSLEAGTEIRIGSVTWRVRHTPGHAPGHVVFVDEAGGYVLGGDVLFRGSIGRTDLWQGSLPVLLRSIETELMTLPEATVVWPGHGPETTLGHERRHNPFLQEGAAY